MATEAKTMLVTGGAGFIGSNLCARLVEEGHRVISLDNYFTGLKENHIDGVDYREGHTKDIAAHVSETPDIVFHLGEYARVEQSFGDIALVLDFNVVGTFSVLEFCRAHGAKLVYAGSSTKFGDGGLGINQSPYAWTKGANTELVKNYGSWFQLPYAITYFYNVYGPRERAGKYGTLIEIFRQRMEEGKPLLIHGPGTQVRNFTHVDDIVEGLVLVGERGEGDEYGLGSEEQYSILDIAHFFGGPIEHLPDPPGNRKNARIDVTKAKALGWSAKKSVKDYIQALTADAAS